jgi:Fe-S cluster assembly iron-binding protein IscA
VAAAPAEGDQVVDEDGTRVFLEPAAASLLDDKVLDAEKHDDHFHFSLGEQGPAATATGPALPDRSRRATRSS